MKNRLLNLILLIAYYILVVTTHQKVGRFVAQNLDIPLGRENYNLLVSAISIASLLLISAVLYKHLKALSKGGLQKVVAYSILTILLIVIILNTILVINVELIHVAQYCVLALLMYPLLLNFKEVMFLGTFLGALDEAYQYWILFPKKSHYLDYNDMILDFTGVVLGLVILRALNYTNMKVWHPLRSIGFLSIVIVAITAAVGGLTGNIHFSLVEGEVPGLKLVRQMKPGFWAEVPPKVKFHIVRIYEFVPIMIVLFITYFNLGNKTNQ